MNLGFPEMVFIFVLALIIFGPKKMPEIGRQIGRALNEFKKASNEFRAHIETEINNIDSESNIRQIMPSFDPPRGAVASGSLASETPSAPPEVMSPPAKAPDA